MEFVESADEDIQALREKRRAIANSSLNEEGSTMPEEHSSVVVMSECIAGKRDRKDYESILESSRDRTSKRRKRKPYSTDYIEDDKARSKALSADKKQLIKRCAALYRRTGTKVALILVSPKNPKTGRTPANVTRYFGGTVHDLFEAKQ